MKNFEEHISEYVNNSAKNFKDEMFNKTMHYQKKYGFKYNENNKAHATWNNEADAFKHAFMQAVGSLRYGNLKTTAGGWWHEFESRNSQPAGEENMDKWNNKIGREIAREIKELLKTHKLAKQQMEDIAAFKIIQRMQKGDLITHPSDKRQYKDYDKYMKNGNATGFAVNLPQDMTEDNIYYSLEDVGKMTTDEFLSAEKTINRQMENGTMQNKEYFESRVKSGELIWVDEYVREDGTKVKGHYRAKA